MKNVVIRTKERKRRQGCSCYCWSRKTGCKKFLGSIWKGRFIQSMQRQESTLRHASVWDKKDYRLEKYRPNINIIEFFMFRNLRTGPMERLKDKSDVPNEVPVCCVNKSWGDGFLTRKWISRSSVSLGKVCEDHVYIYHGKAVKITRARELIVIYPTMYHFLFMVYQRVLHKLHFHLFHHHFHSRIPYSMSTDARLRDLLDWVQDFRENLIDESCFTKPQWSSTF